MNPRVTRSTHMQMQVPSSFQVRGDQLNRLPGVILRMPEKPGTGWW